MHILEILTLGVTQGLTEFIPVSSSGHLVIVQQFFSGASDHLYLEFINVGTLAALLFFFRKKIIEIIHDIFVNKRYKLALNILITAFPAGTVGFMLAKFIESSAFFESLIVVTITTGTVGIIMVILERLPKASAVKGGGSLSPKRALLIGLAQILALIPGVSRSGSTIIAGRLSGLGTMAAAEYSFLVSIPIMLGVTLKLLISDQAYLIANIGPLLVGNIIAFITGIFAVGFLIKYLSRHSMALFGWYRIGLAAILSVVILLQ